MIVLRALMICVMAVVALTARPGAAQEMPQVDLALVLAVDVSFSIQPDEQDIQRRGYVQAFRAPALAQALASGVTGRIAITYLEWSGPDMHRTLVPWVVLSSPQDMTAFANLLESLPLLRSGETALGSAIDAATALFHGLPARTDRYVIDLSSDGVNTSGPPVEQARDRALARGIVINGLPIFDPRAQGALPVDLSFYFRDCVAGGMGGFVMPAPNWQDFERALQHKLVLEIGGLIPERLYQTRLRAQTDCMIGEKLEREKYLQQLDKLTFGKSGRWLPPEDVWPTPD